MKFQAAVLSFLLAAIAGSVTPAIALPPPIINNPGDTIPPGSTVDSLTPLFTWTQITGATAYQLYIWDTSNNQQVYPISSMTLTGSVFRLPSGILQYGRAYQWAMTSFDGANESALSLFRYFQAPPPPPAAPVATSASAVTVSSFDANWNPVSGASGYRIDVSTSATFSSYINNGQDVDVGNTISATVSGLNSSTKYYYRVRAYNSTSTSGNSGTIQAITSPYSLPVPTAQAATFVTTSSFFANWANVILASGYLIDISTSSTFDTYIPGGQDLNVGNNLTTLISGLSPNTTYFYRVRAYDGTGTSANSSTISLTTSSGGLNTPAANPATNITGISFSANWGSVSGATGYRLDVSTTPAFSSFVVGFQNLDVGNVFAKSVTGLIANTTYYYRVRAYNASSTSGNSATITVKTLASSVPAPTATAATDISTNHFTANWISVGGALGYQLDVSTNGAFTTFVSGFHNADEGNITSVLVGGLTANKTYFYRVRAYDLNGSGPYSGTISLTTMPNPPPAPTAKAATVVTNSGFTANWNAASGAAGYRLDVATTNSFSDFVPGYQDLDVAGVLTKKITGLAFGTIYYYRVRAYNVTGTSGNSATITVTTTPNPPSPPTALPATALATNAFTANWLLVTNATGYRLDVSTVSNFSTFVTGFQNLSLGNVSNKAVTGLSPDKAYFYRVRASNAGGASANSATITLTTLPTPPPAPVASGATSITNSGFNANWKASTGATGYRLDVSTNTAFSNFVAGYQNLDVSNVLTTAVIGLNGGTTCYYRVRAYGPGGSSASSARITATTLPNPPVPPVVNPATSVTTTSFTANWTKVTGATGYRLDISTNSAFDSFLAGFQNLDAGNAALRAVSGLSAGNSYYYRLRAYNTGGTGSNSATIAVATIPPAPTTNTPTGITSSGFTANWNAANGATGYRLDVATNSTFTSFVSGFQNLDVSNVLSAPVTGLLASKTYFYRLRAYDASGTSANSTTNSVKTLPPQPPSLATTLQGGNLIISWPTNDPAYKLFYTTSVPATSWISNAAVPAVVSGQYTITNSTAGGGQYYRLKK